MLFILHETCRGRLQMLQGRATLHECQTEVKAQAIPLENYVLRNVSFGSINMAIGFGRWALIDMDLMSHL